MPTTQPMYTRRHWAKAKSNKQGVETARIHLLEHHLADVGACFKALLEQPTIRRRLIDEDHAAHCLLVECFGNIAPKPFRLMLPRDGKRGTLYGYARADAHELRDMASMCACPLQEKALPYRA